METQTKKTLKVELFQVEMPSNSNNSCEACDTIQTKLVSAIQEVQRLFDHLGCEILFKQTTVRTIEEVTKAQIVSSPTIKVGHLDFYPKHLSDSEETREWNWNGQTFSEASKEILIEVLLKGYFEPERDVAMRDLSPYIVKHLKKEEVITTGCGCS